GGLVYWTPALGAHAVHGAFAGYYAGQSWERGSLGYPRTGEYPVPGGVRQDYEGGSLVWDARSGRVTRT
ncbi:LGFP repeat-containing protein, partial [Kineococcus sp. G2]|uniref:LGFP repeat-containing protein n=1 Tax=Kineococcus sp. G2 TaxID=3127484 RepID=UPI003FA5C1A9